MPDFPKMTLLDRLLGEQRISAQMRDMVVNHVEATHCRVEDALIETGVLEESFLLKWLAATYRTRFVSSERLERAEVERAVLAMVPHRLAEAHLLFPVLFDSSDKSLAVVTCDPDEDALLRELALSAGVSRVKAFVARPLAIRASIRKHYGGDQHAFRKMDAGGARAPAPRTEYPRDQASDTGPQRPTLVVPPPSPRGSLATPNAGHATLAPPAMSAFDISLVDTRPRRIEIPFDGAGDTGLYALPPGFGSATERPGPRTDTVPAAQKSALSRSTAESVAKAIESAARTPLEPAAHSCELEVVNVLVSLLENHRNELRGHSAQVARLMHKVGSHIGLSAPDLSALRLCGFLHDIGKVSSYHLTALNVAEYEGHRSQAKKGYLSPVRLFDRGTLPKLAVDGLSHMYERFDGQGFPDRRAGKDIPLAARLLSISETYADLTSNARNPFRKTLSVKAAMSVLGRYRDTVFDGTLLDMFRVAALGEEIASGLLHDRPTIVIVDADVEDTTVLELRLAEHGYAVVPCRTVEQALAHLANGGVDLVIAEVELPQHDGLAFVEQLRAQRGLAELPVLVLTRRADRAAVDRGFALGIVDYMIKPAAAEVVIAKVRNALARAPEVKAARGVTGQLSEMPLPDVLQVLARTRKSGLLRVSAEGKSGELEMGTGAIYNARFGALRGEDAVYAMLSLSQGEFALDPGVAPDSRALHKSTEEFLLEGMRRLDERAVSGHTGDYTITRSDDV